MHRRRTLRATDITWQHAIPVTTPVCTLIDLATQIEAPQLEAAVNEADKRDLTDPDKLRSALGGLTRPGAKALRDTLDRRTFTLTDSELERRFLPLARRAGLPPPETDGLRYHRTPAQQARDRRRDQVHAAAGLTTLRFTRAQVRYEARHVHTTLAAVARRLSPPTHI